MFNIELGERGWHELSRINYFYGTMCKVVYRQKDTLICMKGWGNPPKSNQKTGHPILQGRGMCDVILKIGSAFV